MQLYVQNPKDSTQKLPELTREFGNVTGYKINVQKSGVFLHTNNEVAEKDIKESMSFEIAPKTIRYLRINLTKVMKALYSENCRTLMKEIE